MLPKLSRWKALAIAAGAIAILLTMEIAGEDQVTIGDLLLEFIELSLIVAASVGTILLFNRVEAQHQEQLSLIRDLERARSEGAQWRGRVREILTGLGEAIDEQFQQWGLTAAEREVALLLMKGLSHKEVAEVRQCSEQTARQQARSVYRKSNLGGRAALAAYFLEDLMLPMSPNSDS